MIIYDEDYVSQFEDQFYATRKDKDRLDQALDVEDYLDAEFEEVEVDDAEEG